MWAWAQRAPTVPGRMNGAGPKPSKWHLTQPARGPGQLPRERGTRWSGRISWGSCKCIRHAPHQISTYTSLRRERWRVGFTKLCICFSVFYNKDFSKHAFLQSTPKNVSIDLKHRSVASHTCADGGWHPGARDLWPRAHRPGSPCPPRLHFSNEDLRWITSLVTWCLYFSVSRLLKPFPHLSVELPFLTGLCRASPLK